MAPKASTSTLPSSSSPSNTDLRSAFSSYPTLLASKTSTKPAKRDLVELDNWFRTDLRTTLESRAKDGGAWMNKDELVKLMEWKLTRGKFRPQLLSLISSNSPSLVESTTRSALSSSSPDDPATCLKSLCALKGVGPATASAILSLVYTDTEPFFSDEAWEVVLGSKVKIEYTVKGWEKLRVAMKERLKEFNEENEEDSWNMEKLEIACWSWVRGGKSGNEGKGETKSGKLKGKRKVEEVEEVEAEVVGKSAAETKGKRGKRSTKLT